MNAPVFRSAGLFIWGRNRWGFPFIAAIYTALFIASSSDAGVLRASVTSGLIFFPLIFPISAFVTAGSSATQDLLSPQGFFPKVFFTLPATASQLVLPFMLSAVLLAAVLWIFAIVLIDERVFALGSKQLWIPFLATSFVPWTQALSWTPVRHKAVRVAQWVALITAYITAFACVLNGTLSSQIVIALSVVQFPLAYAAAVHGVAKSRCGEPAPYAKALRVTRANESPSVMPTFASPQHAMFWIERRMHRWSGKAALIAILPAVLILILVLIRLGDGEERNPEGVQMLGRVTIALLTVSLLVIGIGTGLSFAAFRAQATHQGEAFLMPSYFAALPVPTGDFVWAKLKGAIVNMLWVSLGFLVACAFVAQASGLTEIWAARNEAWKAEYGVAGMLLLAALRAAAPVLLALSLTISVMWIALRGPGWGRRFAIANTVFATVVLAGGFIARRVFDLVGNWLPELLWILVTLKICALAALILRVRSNELMSWGRLVPIIGLSVATMAAVFGYLQVYLPEGALTTATALGAAVLIAPALGTIGAPLSLAKNRTG